MFFSAFIQAQPKRMRIYGWQRIFSYCARAKRKRNVIDNKRKFIKIYARWTGYTIVYACHFCHSHIPLSIFYDYLLEKKLMSLSVANANNFLHALMCQTLIDD